MVHVALSVEEDELLTMLEAGPPYDVDRFQHLVTQLIERHWDELVMHLRLHCFGDDLSPSTLATEIYLKAYETLVQQLSQPLDAPSIALSMRYSRVHCPQFVGFLKALARWRPLDAARQARGYRTVLARVLQQAQQQMQQHGTWRSQAHGEPVALQRTASSDAPLPDLWELVRTLPSREQLAVRLYFQHGPEPLSQSAFLELITSMGLPAQEVRALQRRFRRVCRSQHTVVLCHLTHTTIAELFDVDRETIRRLLGKALHRLQEALVSSPHEVSV